MSSGWVITAAHCLDGQETLCVIVHFSNRSEAESVEGSAYINHPDFIVENLDGLAINPIDSNDIAIIKLSEPVVQQSYPTLNNIPITRQELSTSRVMAKVGGYGSDGDNLYVADVWLTAIARDASGDSPPPAFYLWYEGYSEKGDSGSPVFIETDSAPLLVGIVSHRDLNGTYTTAQRISRYLDSFITPNTGLAGFLGNSTQEVPVTGAAGTFTKAQDCPGDSIPPEGIAAIVISCSWLVALIILVTAGVCIGKYYGCPGNGCDCH